MPLAHYSKPGSFLHKKELITTFFIFTYISRELEVGEFHNLYVLRLFFSIQSFYEININFFELFLIQKHFNQRIVNGGVWKFCLNAKTPTIEAETTLTKVNIPPASKSRSFEEYFSKIGRNFPITVLELLGNYSLLNFPGVKNKRRLLVHRYSTMCCTINTLS